MLVVIDIGNTNIVIGVFDGEELTRSWRASTQKTRTSDEYGILLRNLFAAGGIRIAEVDRVTICSVVPPLNDAFVKTSRDCFGHDPLFIDPARQDLIEILYNPPADVGADRIVNAVAAREGYGAPAVVVDFGTATTFDAVSPQGHYLGGIIAPGVRISAEALFARASRLPRIEIRRPPKVIGASTVESIQSGIFYGYVGLIDGILERIAAELPGARVVATGGLAPLIAQESRGIEKVDGDLTVYGLKIFSDRLG